MFDLAQVNSYFKMQELISPWYKFIIMKQDAALEIVQKTIEFKWTETQGNSRLAFNLLLTNLFWKSSCP